MKLRQAFHSIGRSIPVPGGPDFFLNLETKVLPLSSEKLLINLKWQA